MRSCIPMVLLGAGVLAHGEWNTSERFLTECNKTTLYQGETIRCEYVLYSLEDRLEVEVVKFPEFRRLWSDNHVLQQGAFFLPASSSNERLRKGVIGAYTLTPILGQGTPQMTPMKIVVRSPGQIAGQADRAFSSEPVELKVLPLPSAPAGLAELFQGAVGKFDLVSESRNVPFYPGEPTSFRVSLSGRGNLPDINTLPLRLPPEIKLVSQKSVLGGNAAYPTKVFEFVIVAEAERPVEIPAIAMLAFNPFTSRFEKLTTSAFQLAPLPKPKEMLTKEAIDLGPPETQWHSTRPWFASPIFWACQVLLAMIWAGLCIHSLYLKWLRYQNHHPRALLKKRWKEFRTLSPGSPDWLRRADSLVFETLNARTGFELQTRRQAMLFARKNLPGPLAEDIQTIFLLREMSAFSPPPQPNPDTQALASKVWKLQKPLFSRWRRLT